VPGVSAAVEGWWQASIMAAETGAQPSEKTLRSIDLHQIGEHRWMATNRRGGHLSIGPGGDPDFTPVELLLAALAGCGAADLDHITGKRAPFETFKARAAGHKVRDDCGNHLVRLTVTFDVDAPSHVSPEALLRAAEDQAGVVRVRIAPPD